jgi:hypothetical protein
VRVPAGSLSGQPVATVIRRLNALGLTPVIAWAGHTGRPAGTVVSVTPDGPVAPGGTVIVTTAYDSAAPPAAVRVPGVPGTVPTTTAPLPGRRPWRYDAGVATLPFAIVTGALSPVAIIAMKRFGTKLVVAAGLLLMTSGFVVAATTPELAPYWGRIVTAMALMAAGLAAHHQPGDRRDHGRAAAGQGRRRLGRQ